RKPAPRAEMLGDVVGWLGDLGDSTVEVTPRVAPASVSRQYTVTVQNWEHAVVRPVVMTTTLPTSLVLEPDSIGGGAHFDPEHMRLLWQGELEAGESHLVTFRAQPDGDVPAASRVEVT